MYRSYSSILLTLLVVVVFNLSLGLSIFSLEPVGCKLGDCDNGYCLNSTCICDKGWTGSRCQFCDGRFSLTADEGQIYDGAGNYSLSTKCSWLISPEYEPQYDINGDEISPPPIKLTFHYFSTECGWDHLHVFDGSSVYGPLIGSFSGITRLNRELILEQGRGFLYFFSDVAYSMGGFNITYRVIRCPQDCSNHGECNTTSEVCQCDTGWAGEACDIMTSCPNNCSQQGTCLGTRCLCNRLWTGEDCSVSSTDPSWLTLRTEHSPIGRASTGAAVLDDHLYIFGGETLINRFTIHRNNSGIFRFHRYDILNRTWTSIPSNWTESERFGHTLTPDYSTNKLYLYGGTSDESPSSTLVSYDTASDLWQLLPDGIYGVTGHTAHIVDGKLYIFFGQSSVYSFLSYIQVYDIADGNWTIADTSGVHIRGRYGHSSIYHNTSNSVYLFGGYRNNDKAGSYLLEKYLYKFEIDSSTWIALTPATRPLYLHSAVLYSGYMLVTGGNSHNDTTESSGSQCYSDRIMAYHLCCDKWITFEATDLTSNRINRFGHSMFIHDSKLYMYGGYNGLMLDDMVELHIPDCRLFNSSMTCELAGALNPDAHNSDASDLYSFCMWSDSQGCTRRTESDCSLHSCGESSQFDKKAKCNQYTSDCHSCLSTEGCYWRSPQNQDRSQLCDIIPPDANVNPALQELSVCSDTSDQSCRVHSNCAQCHLSYHCAWDSSRNKCLLKEAAVTRYDDMMPVESVTPTLELVDRVCSEPCHTYDSCSNCTNNKCLWCESQNQCIDTNSYLSQFLYGQCLEWATLQSKCQDVSCAETNDCDLCHRNPMCGWCNDPSNTGKGSCRRGDYENDLDKTCNSNTTGTWLYTQCPACQCNGHSVCDINNQCVNCTDNTTGDHCHRCADGFYGDPTNGGMCTPCDCEGIADTCHHESGACLCKVQGAVGDKCDRCDTVRQYYPDTKFSQQCYYRLGVDYRYTFNFSKPEDKHVTSINLHCQPRHEDRDVELTLTCSTPTNINLTLYSAAYAYMYQSIPIRGMCINETIKYTIKHGDYNLDPKHNASLLFQLNNFRTPFVFQVSFTQYSRINLFQFFLVFFGCFLALLIVAGFVWKMKARYAIMQQSRHDRQERRNMASRPFASVMLPVEMITDNSEPDHSYYNTKVQATRQSQSAVDSISPFQRTSSKRNKSKAMQLRSATLVGLEPLEQGRTAVASVLIKLPTGGEAKPGTGCSGLAFASTLVTIGSHAGGNLSSSKVAYKNGKVNFKPQNLFNNA